MTEKQWLMIHRVQKNSSLLIRVVSQNNLIAVKSGAKHMPITFESIPPSHYCEKIRWVLDKLDVAYTEEQDAGNLGTT